MSYGLLTVFGAGLLTLATPCVLPLVPVYLALVAGFASDRRRALLPGTALFVAGFAVVFSLLGVGASAIGAALQTHRSELLVAGGALVATLGLKQLGVLRLGWLDRSLSLPAPTTRFRAMNAFLLGVVFALGWTPCVGPVLGSVLTFAATSSASPLEGALYLFTYAMGVGLPLIAAAVVGERALGAVKRLERYLPKLERVTGGLMLVAGLTLALPAATMLVRGQSALPSGRTELLAALHPEVGDRPVLLAFHSPGCPICDRMAPKIEQLRRDCVGKQVGIVSLDVTESAGDALARAYGVAGVPTLLFLDAQRAVEGMLVGEHPLSELRAAAASLVKTSCGAEQPRIPDVHAQTAACGASTRVEPTPPTCSG